MWDSKANNYGVFYENSTPGNINRGISMYVVFLVILFVFALIPTVDALIERKKPEPEDNDAVITEKMRCKGHLQSIAFLWGGVLAVFVMCLIGGINPKDIGLRLFNFQYNIWITAIALVLCGLACAFLLYQTILPLVSQKQREEAKKQLADDKRAGAVKALPRTKKEKLSFSLLAFSAGTCEEILYRGFMAFLLQAVFPGIPIYLVVLIPSVIFGIGHFYQGAQGVIMTGTAGAVLMCLFLVSGSLIPGMALHFLGDFSSTFLLCLKD